MAIMMKNKKGWIILAVVLVLVIAIVGKGVSAYNGLVEDREKVTAVQADVETYLQRRADLIPNLVSTVKGYAAHEEEVYTALANARAALSGANTVEELNEANSELDSAISRLLVVVENYPELKADAQFINLQDELAGSENRIAKARQAYNETAQSYNTEIQKFPTSVFAKLFGFETADYFEASEDSQTVPSVNFD